MSRDRLSLPNIPPDAPVWMRDLLNRVFDELRRLDQRVQDLENAS